MNPSLLLFLRANRRHLAELLLASALVNAFALALPLFSMLVYDKAMGNQVHDTLWALAAGMALLLALEAVLRISRVLMVEHASGRWDGFLDERLLRGVLAAPLTRPLAVADVTSKMRELAAVRDVLSAQGLLLLADLPFVLVFVAVVALIGGPLVFIPLGFGVLTLLLGAGLQRLSQQRQQVAQGATRLKMNLLVDVLAARESLQGPGASAQAEQQWRSHAQAAARAGARARWWQQLQQQLLPVLMSAASVLLLVAGVFQVEAQEMSVGGLISVNLLSSRLLAVLCGVAPLRSRWLELKRALAALGEAVDLHSPAPALAQAGQGADALATEGLRLEGLGVGYPGQPRPVLQGLNLHLRTGELVAVVGASGAGKTSLLRLLAGRLPHQQGRLVVAGHRIDGDAQRQWLATLAHHKPQDPCFLAGTVREVVAGGDAEASDSALVQALRRAGFGPALDRGDLALNSPTGTNGSGLSGGQRQMLALARALHSRAPLLLLDEPTLGLDRQAQERVIEALPSLKAGRCVLVATHASELIQCADRVLVFDRGQLVADAPPDRLLPSTATWPGRTPARATAPRAEPTANAA